MTSGAARMPCIMPVPAISNGVGLAMSIPSPRHPSVMFGIGPAYLFILKHRLPVGLLRNGWQPWLSTMATNFAIAVIAAGLIRLIGIGPFLFVHLPIMLLAGSVGVWLFYVQHQFEMT